MHPLIKFCVFVDTDTNLISKNLWSSLSINDLEKEIQLQINMNHKLCYDECINP